MKNKTLLIITFLVLTMFTFGCQAQEKAEEKIEKSSLEVEQEIPKELPHIPQKVFDVAEQSMEKLDLVKDAYVEIPESDKNLINMAIQTRINISEEKAKIFGNGFIEMVGKMSAIYLDDIGVPDDNNHGGIYDYYNVMVHVGTSSDNIIATGAKAYGSPKTVW